MDNNELTHWGIKGQKWGRRRFQNKDGTLTAEGIRRYLNRDPDGLKEYKKTNPTQYEQLKQEALKSGNAATILKFQGDLTNKELQDAKLRIGMESELKGIVAKENDAKIQNLLNKADTIKRGAESATGLYNSVAKIINTFSDVELPTVDGKSKAEKLQLKKEKEEKDAREKKLREMDLEEFIKNSKNYTNAEIESYKKRMGMISEINKTIDSKTKKAAEEDSYEKMSKLAPDFLVTKANDYSTEELNKYAMDREKRDAAISRINKLVENINSKTKKD